MLERLVLRPELGAFEVSLRERIDRLAGLEDERLARPRSIDRDSTGLAVVTEFVPGSRLSDLLETSADLGHVPGMDAALGFLLDLLPALCGLHNGLGFAHGTIAPSRIVLTPAGQIVLLDGIYGGALTQLRYGRRKLWQEFGVGTPENVHGSPRLDAAADIAQAALAAVMLVLGRPLRTDEYISNLPEVVQEVVEVAQIRGTASFAAGVQDFLERAFAFDPSSRYASTDDVLFDVRQLASELGAQVCRRALVDFIEQMESPQTSSSTAAEYDDLADEIENYGLESDPPTQTADLSDDTRLTAGVDAELDLDSLVEAQDEVYDVQAEPVTDLHVIAANGVDDEPIDWIQLAAASEAEASIDHAAILQPIVGPAASEHVMLDATPLETLAPAREPEAEIEAAATAEPEDTPPEDVVEQPATADATADAAPAAPEVAAVRARRAKRGPRSARSRKDKLRSVSTSSRTTVVEFKPTPPIAAAAAAPTAAAEVKPASSNWLVAPGSADAFEPVVPIVPIFGGADPKTSPAAAPVPVHVLAPPVMPPLTPSAPVPLYAAPPPPVSVYTPPPAPAPMPPVQVEPAFARTVAPVAPSYAAPPSWTPPPLTPAPGDSTSQLTTARFKDQPSKPRGTLAPEPVSDIYSSAPAVAPPAENEPTAFPWKLAAAAAVIMVVAIVGGRIYLPARGVTSEDVAATSTTTVPPTTVAPATAPPPVRSAPAAVTANAGRLEIETQPAGARILLDGKAAGESPVVLDGIAAGRHTVTFISSSGSVKRTVRIETGRTTKLDVPIFSGWVGIYAPFVVDVVEGGRVIGTTEQPRIMLSPGRHDLTLVNRDLGYSSRQTVDIEPGELRSVTIDPRGVVNLNASPWAEVWVDGRKAGDTPLANLQLPLGTREITFRHPQLGERRVTVTVKGNGPTAVSADMNKP